MPSVILDKFGGQIPRLTNPRKLPKGNAQRAQNVDLTSGDLIPIAVDPPFQSLHNSDGTMKAGLDGGDITYIPKPPAVSESAWHRFTMPSITGTDSADPWLKVTMYVWVTYVDEDDNFQDDLLYSGSVFTDTSYTADGMVARLSLSGTIDFNTVGGIGYTVRGPIFKFDFAEDTDYRGGPNAAFAFPANSAWADPPVHQFTVPLTFPIEMTAFDPDADGRGNAAGLDRFTYGFAELIDYDIPRFEPEIVTENDVTGYEIFSGYASMSFTFRNNYVRDTQQISYYKQAYVDQTVSQGSLASNYTGAQTTIQVEDLQYGADDIPDSGRLYFEKDGGSPSQIVEYTSYVYLSGIDKYEFTIADTLVELYKPTDTLEIIDPAADGREGPPSNPSDLIAREPGTFSVLTTNVVDRYPITKVYRSNQEEDNYRLFDDGKGGDFAFGDHVLAPSGAVYYYFLARSTPLVQGQEYTSLKIESTITAVLSTIPETGVIRITNATGGETQVFYYTSKAAMESVGSGWYTVEVTFAKTETADYAFDPNVEQVNLDLWEVEDGQLYDRFVSILSDPLPLEGNYPHDSREEAMVGSLLHPAGWGSIIDGSKLYPSDVRRPWVYPADSVVRFDTPIIAQVVSGNSILVFTEASTDEVGKVIELVGNNPEYLAMYELSNAHPLLNKGGLAKIGQTVLWPTYDGLAATSGGSVQTLTEAFFTREEWGDQLPTLMDAYTSENTVWLTTANALNWRVDLDELQKGEDPDITLSTYTAFSGKPFIWDSKIFTYQRPLAFNSLRVLAEQYPVAVEFYNGKGELRHGELVMNDQVKKVAKMRTERDWYIRVHGTNTVYSVGFATNPKELSGDGG